MVQLSVVAGKSLTNFRKKHNKSQSDIAKKLDISVSGLSKIENGSTSVSLEQLFLFAEVYSIDIGDIISEIELNIRELESSGFVVINSKSAVGKKLLNSISKSSIQCNLIDLDS